jgi:hypothetical protein
VLHAGPYVAYGIGGKVTGTGRTNVDGTDISVAIEQDVFGEDGIKRFDFGIGLGVGVEFGRFGVGLGYDLGLANLTGESNYRLNNMNAFLRVGYRF